MKIGVLKEMFPGERRVALVPASLPRLQKAGAQVVVESGAGAAAGYPDDQYEAQGGQIADRGAVLGADIVLGVRILGSAGSEWGAALEGLRTDAVLVGMCDPLGEAPVIAAAAERGWTIFSLELIPRITRAQRMDVLSSMATVAGYRAVLLAAVELPRMFPLLMTAAGTVTAARVFVIGAGVAGLQALATAKRLGAVCQAYDVRAATREQVESVGAKFIELSLPEQSAEDKGGYAKQLAEDFYQKQRELMASVVAESDVVITTAAIPGRPSPLLITQAAVDGMPPGSVVVDLAAERGGNCETTQADQRIVTDRGVTILGPTNLPSEVPYHASLMFSNNVTNFLLNLIEEGSVKIDQGDEIIRDTLAAHGGQVVQQRLRSILDLPPLAADESSDDASPDRDDDRTAADDSAAQEGGDSQGATS